MGSDLSSSLKPPFYPLQRLQQRCRVSFWVILVSVFSILNNLRGASRYINTSPNIASNAPWNNNNKPILSETTKTIDHATDLRRVNNSSIVPGRKEIYRLQTKPFPVAAADPMSLRRGIESFLWGGATTATNDENNDYNNTDGDIWDLLEHYPPVAPPETTTKARGVTVQNERRFYYYDQDVLSSELVCGAGPGRGMEQDAGYKLLMEKIRITENMIPAKNWTRADDASSDEPRVLCLVYTYSPMRYLLRAQALTWGKNCDGFLAFSNETLPELGIYRLPPPLGTTAHHGREQQEQEYQEESYDNMWQKTRMLWKVVHDRFLDSFDYFYLAGDDVYLLVENLRAFLRELEALESNGTNARSKPRHFGSWLPARSMVAGGPGYVLNRAALEQYAGKPPIDRVGALAANVSTTRNQEASNMNSNSNSNSESVWSHCLTDRHKSYEDRYISQCLSEYLGIHGNDTDTRDPSTAEQRFHDTDPATLYTFRAAKYPGDRHSSYFSRMALSWEHQLLPWFSTGPLLVGETATVTNSTNGTTIETKTNRDNTAYVGPKHGLEAAARHSISLHKIYTPTYMSRIHAILHPLESCPVDSPLGKGLRRHSSGQQ